MIIIKNGLELINEDGSYNFSNGFACNGCGSSECVDNVKCAGDGPCPDL